MLLGKSVVSSEALGKESIEIVTQKRLYKQDTKNFMHNAFAAIPFTN